MDGAFLRSALAHQTVSVFEVVDDAASPSRILYSFTLNGQNATSDPDDPDGTPEERTEPNLELAMDQNRKVSVNIREDVFGYTIIVPQDVSCEEGAGKIETQVAAETVNGLPQYTDEAGNQWKGRVDVSVSGLEPLAGETSEYGLLLRTIGASETSPVQVRTIAADGKEQILTAAENTLVSFDTDVYQGLMLDPDRDPNAGSGTGIGTIPAPTARLVFYPQQEEGRSAGVYRGKLNFVIRYREEQISGTAGTGQGS